MTIVKRMSITGVWIPVAIAISLALGGDASPPTRAGAATLQPEFTRPLEIDHPLFPFEPGAMNVLEGTVDDEPMTVVVRCLPEVRVFRWNDAEIPCAIVEETEFEAGALAQISYAFYAQDDDGAIWFFGEFSEEYEDGELVSRSGSWLVGGPGPDDPEDTATADAPSLHLTASPAPGEVWVGEDIPDADAYERRTVLATERVVRVPANEYGNCTQIEEQGPEEIEVKWYAPGVGVIAVQSESEKLKLVATSIRRR